MERRSANCACLDHIEEMARPINSFDVFDTLIARRRVEPKKLPEKLEIRAGLPGLAANRLAADRKLGTRGRPWSLHDIWMEVGRELNLDAATTDRLEEFEIQIEHEEVIPITENLALVNDGDVLISDTYLPAGIVLSLLRKAGLQ
jgi:predicted HAD superfamily hydrolase